MIAAGQVRCWGETIMLILRREQTNVGEKWVCLILNSDREASFPPGCLAYFRDLDFASRLA